MNLVNNFLLWVDVVFVKDIEVLVITFLIPKGIRDAHLSLIFARLRLVGRQLWYARVALKKWIILKLKLKLTRSLFV